MEYTLFVGDYAYSSWSLRGWLVLDAFGIGFSHRYARLGTPAFAAMLAGMAPARQVPALSITDGAGPPVVVWESLAIAETLHEVHPEAGIWPADRRARAAARALAAEMHAGFRALRTACPMNMRRAYAGFRPDAGVLADLARLAELWAHGREQRKGDGPFMFGAFSAADAFFAPVASRIATYALEVGPEDALYVWALLRHPSLRRWRAMAFADAHVQPHYELDLPGRPDSAAPEVVGRPVAGRTAENLRCPFTGVPAVSDLQVEVGGRVLGFGDAFARDKAAADPLAWPEVAALLA